MIELIEHTEKNEKCKDNVIKIMAYILYLIYC